MDVRIAGMGPRRVETMRRVDEPVSTISASAADRGRADCTGWLEVLVERGESVAKVKAQRSGAITQVEDVDDRQIGTITAFTPTDVYLDSGEGVRFRPGREPDGKPPYRVPTVAETKRRRPRHRRPVVVSTFSGAGGSCYGYRMAGYDVRAAVEIAPVPAASYAANFPGSRVFVESIRDVDPAALLEAAGVARGELDLLDGSPPCTSFSTAGQRAKTWGKVRRHAGVEQRIDDLFFDYAKLVDALQPRAFVAENVAGLARGVAIGYFKAILRALRQLGYLVRVQRLDAALLGVPQHRERLFFVGLRADVAERLGYRTHEDLDDLFPRALEHSYTVRDALPWLDPDAEAYSLQGTPFGTPERIANGTATPPERVKPADVAPAATILAGGSRAGVRVRRETGGRNQAARPKDYLDEASPSIVAGGSDEHGNVGANAAHYKVEQRVQHGGGRAHWTKGLGKASPTIVGGATADVEISAAELAVVHDKRRPDQDPRDVLDEPLPTLTASEGREGRANTAVVMHDAGRAGRDARDVTDEAAPTLVLGTDDPAAGGGARNHWKVVEEGPGGVVLRRKFTIIEVKRLCSFPDDYVLEGKFAEQWAQCGNSVPPLMMRALAGRIRERVFDRLEES